MAPNVWVIEQRLGMTDMLMLADFEVTLAKVTPYGVPGTEVKRVKVRDLYNPVWMGGPIWDDGKSVLDFKGSPTPHPEATPYSYWLKMELVAPSERVRFPELAAKINYKEGVDLGDTRELYSWDGTGFKLRDEAWGRP
jgi:hypothetical protein